MAAGFGMDAHRVPFGDLEVSGRVERSPVVSRGVSDDPEMRHWHRGHQGKPGIALIGSGDSVVQRPEGENIALLPFWNDEHDILARRGWQEDAATIVLGIQRSLDAAFDSDRIEQTALPPDPEQRDLFTELARQQPEIADRRRADELEAHPFALPHVNDVGVLRQWTRGRG